MRLNKFLALSTGVSRRAADDAIANGEVFVNNTIAQLGQAITPGKDKVKWRGSTLQLPDSTTTILLNKPPGYVCSRNGQGSKTIYDILPAELHSLKPVGRLDKDSSGLLLLTNDGDLAQKLTHPAFHKEKQYEIYLDGRLSEKDEQTISNTGVILEDGPSRFELQPQNNNRTKWLIKMSEGRNRQIRRTFQATGHIVTRLHRIKFGDYTLDDTQPGSFKLVSPDTIPL